MSDPDDKKDTLSTGEHRLLRRLGQSHPEAPLDEEEQNPAADTPLEHVRPFTVDALDDFKLKVISISTENLADEPREALERLEEKMAQITRDLARGEINQSQFQAVYTHYSEQREVVQRIIERNPDSNAWQRAAVEGRTGMLRDKFAARLEGLSVYENDTGQPLERFGLTDLPAGLLDSLLVSLNQPVEIAASGAVPPMTQIEEGRWLCFVQGQRTSAAAIFSAEPSASQLAEQARVHTLFEETNEKALSTDPITAGWIRYIQTQHFDFPAE